MRDDHRVLEPDELPGALHEITEMTVRAMGAQANDWPKAAWGYLEDAVDQYGAVAVVRISYVLGAGRFFLPAPPGSTSDGLADWSRIERFIQDRDGQAPAPFTVAQATRALDVASTLMRRIAEAASKGDVGSIASLLADADQADQWLTLTILLRDAATRMRYSRQVEDRRSWELFRAHIDDGLTPEPPREGAEEGLL